MNALTQSKAQNNNNKEMFKATKLVRIGFN